MNRAKFLVFSFLVFLTWGAHLAFLSPAVHLAAQQQAEHQAYGVLSDVQNKLATARSVSRLALLKIAAHENGSIDFKTNKTDALTFEIASTLAQSTNSAFAEVPGQKFIYGVAFDDGILISKGNDAPTPPPLGWKLSEVLNVGFGMLSKDGKDSSVPVLYVFEKLETSLKDGKGPTVFVGVPIEHPVASNGTEYSDDAWVILGKDGKALRSSDQKKMGPWTSLLKEGKGVAFLHASAQGAGFLSFPILTRGDIFGGEFTAAVGVQQALPRLPLSVVAIASLDESNQALAGYQTKALILAGVLLLLTLVIVFLIQDHTQGYMSVPTAIAPVQRSASSRMDMNEGVKDLLNSEPQAVPETSPDDFQFGGAKTDESAVPPHELGAPAEDSRTRIAPPPSPDSDSGEATRVMMPSEPSAEGGETTGEYPPEMTRYQNAPMELIQKSSKSTGDSDEYPMGLPNPVVSAPPVPRNVAPLTSVPAKMEQTDEEHWKQVFEQFVSMRSSLGEPAEALSYDKFVVKLQKNREQLIAKYNCRTVRFQVYAKDGKAALKAAPVKD